jgi:hypothetical protein
MRCTGNTWADATSVLAINDQLWAGGGRHAVGKGGALVYLKR